MASSNTIGVFLETVKPSASSKSRGPDDLLTDVIAALARRGGKASVVDLGKELGVSPSEYMSAVFVGRDRGLLEFREENEEQVIDLTKLGTAFSDVR